MSHYTPEEKVKIARDPGRPGTADFISALFTDFFEQRGDRQCREDGSILGGIALLSRPPRDSDRPPEGQEPGGELRSATSGCPGRRAIARPSG